MARSLGPEAVLSPLQLRLPQAQLRLRGIAPGPRRFGRASCVLGNLHGPQCILQAWFGHLAPLSARA
jgi:hypothetical protein